VDPEQVPDLLALLGDSVDNIPGIQGVGGKTASRLLAACRTIEEIAERELSHVAIRGREGILKRIRENLDSVCANRELARIRCHLEIGSSPDELRYRRGRPEDVLSLCKELGFERMVEEIPLRYDQPGLFD
jgi:DNA polymerase-1